MTDLKSISKTVATFILNELDKLCLIDANILGIDKDDIHGIMKNKIRKEDEPHFISVYFYLMNYIFHGDTPVLGVIERNTGSTLIVRSILDRLEKENGIQTKEARLWKDRIREYKVTDAILFACLLQEGEYIEALPIDKNEIHKSPNNWKPVIENFPKPITTYLKVSENSYPFRIEIHPANKDLDLLLSITYHMARLLPHYGFPVGLDIVDKYAKIPAWMSKQVSKEQGMNLLKVAINSGRPDVIDLVKLYLSGNQRDWLFRPKSNK